MPDDPSRPSNQKAAPIQNHPLASFSETTLRLIVSRENMGFLEDADGIGLYRGRCGDRMQIDLRLDGEKIIQATFLADGCGATLACGSMLTRMAISKTLAQAGKITPEELLSALGGLPQDHQHCAELAVLTLREAILDARNA